MERVSCRIIITSFKWKNISFTDRVTNATYILVLFDWNFAPVTFGLTSVNTQSSVYDKSSSTYQKLLRYFSGMVISTFKTGFVGCGSPSASPSFPGRGGRAGVFPVMLVLYLKENVRNFQKLK